MKKLLGTYILILVFSCQSNSTKTKKYDLINEETDTTNFDLSTLVASQKLGDTLFLGFREGMNIIEISEQKSQLKHFPEHTFTYNGEKITVKIELYSKGHELNDYNSNPFVLDQVTLKMCRDHEENSLCQSYNIPELLSMYRAKYSFKQFVRIFKDRETYKGLLVTHVPPIPEPLPDSHCTVFYSEDQKLIIEHLIEPCLYLGLGPEEPGFFGMTRKYFQGKGENQYLDIHYLSNNSFDDKLKNLKLPTPKGDRLIRLEEEAKEKEQERKRLEYENKKTLDQI